MQSEFHFDEESADGAVEFIETLCSHVKGELAGKHLILSEWEKEKVIKPLFGWKRKDGTRKYRYAWIEIPRKNGKSTLSSSIALYLLFGDGEAGAEIYNAASSRDQAKICFDISAQMIRQNETLTDNGDIFQNSIVLKGTNSFLKVISAEAYSKHGFNAHGIIFDEIHAQPNRELWDVLTTSIGSRKQPVVIAITTAGIMRKGHIAWDLHTYAQSIKKGTIKDEQFLSVIYQADSIDDPFSEETWKKCNPGYGLSVKKEYLLDEAKKAKQQPSYLNTFKRLHLNVWTSTEKQFISPANWDACNLMPLTEQFFYGKKCKIAFDLGATRDFTALVICTFEDGIYHIMPYIFIPEKKIGMRNMRDQIETWVREGYIISVPGDVLDYEFVYKKITELSKNCTIAEISYDRWNKSWLTNQLKNDGANCYDFGQGYKSMSPATKEFEKLIIEKKINHGGNPVLAWMNENMAITEDAAGNIKPDKSKSTEKIDGMIASIMAVSRMIESPPAEGSIYEKRGTDIWA